MLTGLRLHDSYIIRARDTLEEREADMLNPHIGGEMVHARLHHLREEARQDGRARLARRRRGALRLMGAWRQAVGMRLIDAGVRLLGPSAEARDSVEAR